MDTKKLAKQIAKQLFTDGSKKHATRLVLEYPGGVLTRTGWAEAAVADVIEEMLNAELAKEKKGANDGTPVIDRKI